MAPNAPRIYMEAAYKWRLNDSTSKGLQPRETYAVGPDQAVPMKQAKQAVAEGKARWLDGDPAVAEKEAKAEEAAAAKKARAEKKAEADAATAAAEAEAAEKKAKEERAAEEKAAAKEAKKGPADPAERAAAITKAIGGLDKNNDALWTSKDAPQVKAIEAALGWDISAGERNAAWKAMKPEPAAAPAE